MDKERSATIIALTVICALSGLMAWITKHYPPREINWLYGYRTSRSMRTPATWHEANRYMADYFWRLNFILPVVAVGAYLVLRNTQAVLVLILSWILGILIGLVRTENRLKRLFDKEGKPHT